MHVLTKVFIVLVALLAIMLVPLVVVYATNEDTFKARYLETEAEVAAARTAAERAVATAGADRAKLEGEITLLRDQNADFQRQLAERNAETARLQSETSQARLAQSQVNDKIASIEGQLGAAQTLLSQLVTENSELRTAALSAEGAAAELETRLREVNRNLEVSDSAVRSLQEEVHRLTEANARSLETIGFYTQLHGPLPDQVGATQLGPVPTTKIVAHVVEVHTENGAVLAEINVGQRDGVKEGMVLTLGDDTGFIGTLRIIRVDLNRAVGIAEDASGEATSVPLNARAVAFPRR